MSTPQSIAPGGVWAIGRLKVRKEERLRKMRLFEVALPSVRDIQLPPDASCNGPAASESCGSCPRALKQKRSRTAPQTPSSQTDVAAGFHLRWHHWLHDKNLRKWAW